MSLKILGVITETKIDKIKVNKYIDDLSNKLSNENISHLIIDDSIDGIGIMLEKDAPNFLIHNDIDSQWEYLDRYIEDEDEEATLNKTYIIEDNNKNIDIIKFLKIVLNAREGK